ncbi:MAG: KTSC domain-containing protein [Bacteroidales bacterium]|nr:KTSC domain-containing protein [Bacteroidales bacterium]
MKRVNEYKKLFKVEGNLELKKLKSTYRNLVKEWHPDKFQACDEKAIEAEQKSREIIDAYHFLVSIAPETHELNKAEYEEIITKGGITDIRHKGLLLEISFLDGTTFECFGVPKSVYVKLMNSDKQTRFVKRNIFGSYLYRKSKKAIAA